MKKLLVVDDDRGNRVTVVDIVMSEWPDCEVLTAPNGKIGFEIAKFECPEIIILDWEMPEMDGLTMLKAMRAHPETKEIPVVMYTGFRTDSEHLRLALGAGANEFLRKPVDPIELIARIHSIQLQVKYFNEKRRAENERNLVAAEAQERELMLKRNELTSLALILEQKDLFLKELLKEMEDCWGVGLAGEQGQRYQQILRKLRHELKAEKNWDAIQVRMNSIHSGFLGQLVEKHPDLTKNDLKLCSLMKLNLSRKETASILHISVAGVEKRRYRLRKKMGLDPNVKMENYIHSLTRPAFV